MAAQRDFYQRGHRNYTEQLPSRRPPGPPLYTTHVTVTQVTESGAHSVSVKGQMSFSPGGRGVFFWIRTTATLVFLPWRLVLKRNKRKKQSANSILCCLEGLDDLKETSSPTVSCSVTTETTVPKPT